MVTNTFQRLKHVGILSGGLDTVN